MTYTDPKIIKVMLENNGVYPGDPQMARIYKYNGDQYAVFMRPEHDDMHVSPWVRGYEMLFDATVGLTVAGKRWLDAYKKN